MLLTLVHLCPSQFFFLPKSCFFVFFLQEAHNGGWRRLAIISWTVCIKKDFPSSIIWFSLYQKGRTNICFLYSQIFKIIHWFPITLQSWLICFHCHYKCKNFNIFDIYSHPWCSHCLITSQWKPLKVTLESFWQDPWLKVKWNAIAARPWAAWEMRAQKCPILDWPKLPSPTSAKYKTAAVSYSSPTDALTPQPMAYFFVSIFVKFICHLYVFCLFISPWSIIW